MTYYFISAQGDDENTGLEGYPWQTFERALPELVAGDTLLIESGTYTEPIVIDGRHNDGEEGWPITLAVLVSGGVVLKPPKGQFALTMTGKQHWVIEGQFDIRAQVVA